MITRRCEKWPNLLKSLNHTQTYLKRPRDFSAAAFPISMPFFLRPMASCAFSFPHRLHWVRRAKFRFLQLMSVDNSMETSMGIDNEIRKKVMNHWP